MSEQPWYKDEAARQAARQVFERGGSGREMAQALAEHGYPGVRPAAARRYGWEAGWTRPARTAETPPAEPTPEEQLAARVAEEKQRDAERYQRRRLAELAKEEARFSRLLDLIRDVTAAIPMPVITPPDRDPRADGAERVCLFVLSDIQVGIAMDPLEVGERLAYNSATLDERFERYEAEVWRFLDEQARVGPIESILLVMPGDLLENHQLRIAARQRTDLALTTAAITLNRKLAAFLARLYERYGVPIEIDILPGNHDRIGGGKQGDERTYDNWAVVIGEMLRLQFAAWPGITVHVHYQEYAILAVGAARIMLHHGHGIQGTALLPWYGIDRRVGRWEGFHRQQFNYVLLGHFHNPAMWQTTSGAKVYINGAWFDSTAYGASLGLATPAQQLAFALTEHEGIVYTRELALSDPIAQTPAERRGFGLDSAA